MGTAVARYPGMTTNTKGAGARLRRLARLALPAMVAAASALPAPAADLGLDGSYASQDCGSGTTCVRGALILRWAAGDRTRWRASFATVRSKAPEGVAVTLAGSMPLGEEQLRRRMGSGGEAGGSGAPRKGATASAAATTAATVVEEEQEWSSGPGDLYAGVTTRLAGGGSRLFALDAEADLKAPVAGDEEGLGTGEWDGRIGLAGQRRFWALTLFGGLGWSRLGDPEWATLKDAPDAFVGMESEPVGPGLRWSAWAEGVGEVVEDAGPVAVLAVGCRQSGAAGWTATLRAGLTGASEIVAFRLGYRWGAGLPQGRRGGPDA